MSYKYFHRDFQGRLWQVIADIERESQVELVVVIRNRATDYHDIPLYWGLVGAWCIHSFLIFSPALFVDEVIYFGPLLVFMLCWAIGKMPLVQYYSLSKKRRQKSVETMGRALFQKGGIQHTQAKIGVLVYCSLLERSTMVLADRGAELAVPAEEWQLLRQRLQNIFKVPSSGKALLSTLADARQMFKYYLPPTENDINELPDDLEIIL